MFYPHDLEERHMHPIDYKRVTIKGINLTTNQKEYEWVGRAYDSCENLRDRSFEYP